MIILGIDPGTATTGFGVVKKERQQITCLDFGVIKTSPKQLAGQRLEIIYQQLSALLKKYHPSVLAVEKLFFFKNLKTALPVSEALGVILLLASQKNLAVIEFTPLQVKTGLCGYGRAEKKQVQKMAQQVLGLKKPPRPDDAAYSLALAICCCYFHKP